MAENLFEKCQTPPDCEDEARDVQLHKGDALYYRLASPLSARVEGHSGKVSLFLLFAVIWAAGLIVITVANLVTGTEFEVPAIVILCVFTCIAVGFLVFGIIDQKRQLSANAQERALLKNCICTDGRIEKYVCIEHCTHSRGTDSYSYEVTIIYSYTDLSGKTARGTHNVTYGYDPEFYKGQYLMIAFSGNESRILSRFKFKREDEKAFLLNEAARSDDDFEGLDGKLLKRAPTKKTQSAELPYVWLWAALALFVFVAAYTVPMTVCVVPQLVGGPVIPAVIGAFFIYLMPAILTAVIVYFLRRFFKGKGRLRKILNNGPRFTRGKIFASEKTYREGAGKKILYCYIDEQGKRHTEVLTTPYYRKTVQDKALTVTVAYDKDGDSVPLHS